MTDDRHDAQIRDLVAELAASAPPAPAFNRIADRLPTTARGAAMSSTAPVPGVRPDGSADLAPSYVTDRAPRGRPWRLMAALVAFSVAAAGGVFAYGALSEDDGTATPEAAVEKFVDAFAQSDVSGMLEALAPSERVVLRESLESLNSQASRLELTKDLDLADVAGVDLEVVGLQLSSTGLSEDVARVNVKGTVRTTASEQELPLGNVARDLLVDSLPDNGYQGVADALEQAINDGAQNGMEIVTLKEADGWHVSVWYTVAEYLRRNSGLSAPAFGRSPITPAGADSPEAAVRALVEATGDFEKAVATTAPDESRVLYDYVPLWVRSIADEQGITDHTVHSLETHVEGDGDRRVVFVDAYDVEVTFNYTYTTVEDGDGTTESTVTEVSTQRHSFDGDCFSFTFTSDQRTVPESTQTDKTCKADALANGATPLEWQLETQTRLTVVRQDGKWFLSPVGSLVGETVAQLASVPDAAAFKALATGERASAHLVLPYDVLGFAFGSPFAFSPGLLIGSESFSGSSEGSGGSIESPAPSTSLPQTVDTSPETTVTTLSGTGDFAPYPGAPEPAGPSTTVVGPTGPQSTTTATSVPASPAPVPPSTATPPTTGG